jgi:2-iminobutanoate/2-iminopropanoate deaminase
MQTRKINSPDAPEPVGGYSQAFEIGNASRILFVSGQIPVRADGTTPESFLDQARVAWANVEAQLKAADMGLENIVKHTTFLADRKYREENRQVRREVFGEMRPALTVVIAGIFDEAWLLEIEAIAAS